jgi:hypothetical protein
MYNITNHNINQPYVKFNFIQNMNKFPKDINHSEKYYKDRYERKKEEEKEHYSVGNNIPLD